MRNAALPIITLGCFFKPEIKYTWSGGTFNITYNRKIAIKRSATPIPINNIVSIFLLLSPILIIFFFDYKHYIFLLMTFVFQLAHLSLKEFTNRSLYIQGILHLTHWFAIINIFIILIASRLLSNIF